MSQLHPPQPVGLSRAAYLEGFDKAALDHLHLTGARGQTAWAGFVEPARADALPRYGAIGQWETSPAQLTQAPIAKSIPRVKRPAILGKLGRGPARLMP